MNVLIIPEDFRKDQYVVKPIVKRMFAEIGKPKANVQVCQDPLMGGIGEVLKWARIDEVLEMYPMVQIFLILVDRDGKAGRREALNHIEQEAKKRFGRDNFKVARVLVGENAWQEIEVWALAGQDLPGDWRWQEIRAEIHPKERFFAPWAAERGLTHEPGEGRVTMGREAATNYQRVRQRCPDDIQRLENKLREWLGQQ